MTRLLPVFLAALFTVGACGGDDDDDDDNDVATPDAMVDTPDATAAPDAAAPPTWTNFADDFFTVYCHMCHGPGDALRDYSVMAEVQAEATRIRGGVDSMQFPVGTGAKPIRAERDRLLLWIDNGLPL